MESSTKLDIVRKKLEEVEDILIDLEFEYAKSDVIYDQIFDARLKNEDTIDILEDLKL